ncbi:MAG TPA: hypothetical protein VF717_07950, partial [Pyrinomonadaceae bacterium]
ESHVIAGVFVIFDEQDDGLYRGSHFSFNSIRTKMSGDLVSPLDSLNGCRRKIENHCSIRGLKAE